MHVGYPQMATIRHGVVQIYKEMTHLRQFNSDLDQTLNLASWGTNMLSQLVCLIQMGYNNFLYLCEINSDLLCNFKT